MANPVRPAYAIQSVDKALRLLLLLQERGRLRISETSRELHVANSTAHRLMSMLVYHGFAERDGEAGAYKLGGLMLRVGLAAVHQHTLRSLARPAMQQLLGQVNETVHLAELDGSSVHFIDSLESTQALRVVSRAGRSLPAHATSAGKAMLAQLSEDELYQLYPDEELPGPPVTERTVTTRTQLFRVLTNVRRNGFARNAEESERGVGSVGVALSRALANPISGLSVAVPDVRMDAARMRNITGLLREAVAGLEKEILRMTTGA